MTGLGELRSGRSECSAGELAHVGLGRVVGCESDGRPCLRLMFGAAEQVVADWALPYRYQPVVGDLLQVIGRCDRYWITGVVQGHGRSHMASSGSMRLSARGRLRLRGDVAMRLSGPGVTSRATVFETVAVSVVQKLGELRTAVRGLLTERAGQSSRMIDGEDYRAARRHETVAREAVKVDADLLRLG